MNVSECHGTAALTGALERLLPPGSCPHRSVTRRRFFGLCAVGCRGAGPKPAHWAPGHPERQLVLGPRCGLEPAPGSDLCQRGGSGRVAAADAGRLPCQRAARRRPRIRPLDVADPGIAANIWLKAIPAAETAVPANPDRRAAGNAKRLDRLRGCQFDRETVRLRSPSMKAHPDLLKKRGRSKPDDQNFAQSDSAVAARILAEAKLLGGRNRVAGRTMNTGEGTRSSRRRSVPGDRQCWKAGRSVPAGSGPPRRLNCW